MSSLLSSPRKFPTASYRAEWMALLGFLVLLAGMLAYLFGRLVVDPAAQDIRLAELEAMMAVGYLSISTVAIGGLILLQWRRTRRDMQLETARAALASSERFMRSLIDVVPGMVGYWTAELRCTFSNNAYQSWFGRSPEQMKGIRIQALMGEELFRKNEPYIQAALRGEHQSFERTLTKADGNTGYTWASYIPDIVDGQVHGFFAVVVDITELKKAEQELAEKRRFLSDLVEHSPTPIFAKDRAGAYQLVNDEFERSTGLTRASVIGKTDAMIYPGGSASRFRQHDLEVMQTGRPLEVEEVLERIEGTKYYLSVKFPLRDENGDINGVCGISTDITERKQAEQEIERLSRTDVLTGLPNRRHFMEAGQREVERTERHYDPLSLLMLDVDHFKDINDRHGHHLGDVVLARLGRICLDVIREIDLPGRIGGEEFAIILPQTDSTGAMEVAERLRRAIEQAEVALADGALIPVTVSIGVATLLGQGSLNELLMAADRGLYRAKRAGRNRVADAVTVGARLSV